MSSINLLPKSFVDKKYLVKRKRDTYLISCFMLLFSIAAFTIVFLMNNTLVKELSDIDSRLNELDVEIKMGLNENKLPVEEYIMNDAKILLDSHNYYSKALNVVQKIINNDVYLMHGGFNVADQEDLIFSFSGFAKNYMAAIEQIAVLKDSFWIKKVNIYTFTSDKDEGVEFEGDVVFNRDILLYREEYFNFGLEILSLRTNRFLKLENYSANLIESVDDEDLIEIEFDGIAYDKDKLILLEKSLENASRFVKSVSVSYDLDGKQESDFIRFKGNMQLWP
ncbi:MAG: hypothetical protein KAI67_02235 [Candidatus Pacebacteria bacterium]|nr:hypothetical protein [Candidatus Paceibacterota bacterium]